MYLFYILIIILFSSILQANVNINSVIKLKENVPEECGLTFTDNTKKIFAEITIKKHNSKNTLTTFRADIEGGKVKNANLKSFSNDILSILGDDSKNSNEFIIENTTKDNQMSLFIQEVLIGNSILSVNDIIYEIKGPIDSKVRLEYLFCTGEMFLPNYESNENE